MNRNFAIVAAIATVLLITTISAVSITTPENAFAYEKNQAASQTNACGNSEIPTNVGCQNTDSQIQGDENAVAQTAQQIFPERLVIPELEPETCIECFINELFGLTEIEIAALGGITTIGQLCALIELFPNPAVLHAVGGILIQIGVDHDRMFQIIDCLTKLVRG